MSPDREREKRGHDPETERLKNTRRKERGKRTTDTRSDYPGFEARQDFFIQVNAKQ